MGRVSGQAFSCHCCTNLPLVFLNTGGEGGPVGERHANAEDATPLQMQILRADIPILKRTGVGVGEYPFCTFWVAKAFQLHLQSSGPVTRARVFGILCHGLEYHLSGICGTDPYWLASLERALGCPFFLSCSAPFFPFFWWLPH